VLVLAAGIALGRPEASPVQETPVATAVASPTRTTPTPAASVTFTEGIAGRPLYLNPLLSQFSAADRDLATLLFSGLTKPGPSGEMLPDLAERWEISGDGKQYTFYLRQGARWQDGSLVTSDDVTTTIRLMQQPGFPGVPALAAFWRGILVDAVDSRTVRFVLKSPYAPFPEAVSVGLLQARKWAGIQGAALADSELNDAPIGTGPYRIRQVVADGLILESNPWYYGAKPAIGEIAVRFYPDSQSLTVALKRGEVTAAARLSATDLSTLSVNPEIRLQRGPLASFMLVYLNTKLPYFQDRGTRQALMLALDRQRLVDRFAGGAGQVIDSPILPQSWAYSAQVRKYATDLDQARSLLDKAGWKVGSDGARTRDDVSFEFTLLANDDPARFALAEEISRQWGAIGVKANVERVGIYPLLRDYVQPRRFDALLYGWSGLGYDPDPYELWHSSQATGDGGNFAGLVDPRYDELLEDARTSVSQAERTRLYQQFQEMFAEQVPVLLLYQMRYTYAMSSRVSGFEAVLLADPAYRFRQFARLSVGNPSR
jgi:peptide/nickel transport system substrate-binding protein